MKITKLDKRLWQIDYKGYIRFICMEGSHFLILDGLEETPRKEQYISLKYAQQELVWQIDIGHNIGAKIL